MRYTELEPLASGGMGSVTLCVGEGAEGFRRIYARKRIHAEFATEPEFRQMFVQEAKLAAAVRHANVVSVLDVGEDPDGVYLVMEYIEGVSLAAMLAALAKQGERLPIQIAVRVLRDVAAGLLAIHSATDEHGRPLEIVHRDISPQNVLVGIDGVARVADFGVAKAAYLSGRTASGVLKGKLGYAAPEQLRFEPVDHRCDLFSFGVVCWETLTSERLYQGREGARAILSEPPPDLADERDVPDELAALLFWLLAKEPSARPESAEPVIEVLERVLASLVSDEGAFDVRSFVRTRFEDSSRERRERIRTKLESLGGPPDARSEGDARAEATTQPRAAPSSAAPPRVEGADAEEPATVVERPTRSVEPDSGDASSVGGRRVWLGVLVVAVALFGALGLWWSSGGSSGAASGGDEGGDEQEPVASEIRPGTNESTMSAAMERTSPDEGDERGGEVQEAAAATAEGRSVSSSDDSEGARGRRIVRERSTEAAAERRSERDRAEPRATTSAVEAPVAAESPEREGRGVVVDMTATWEWEN